MAAFTTSEEQKLSDGYLLLKRAAKYLRDSVGNKKCKSYVPMCISCFHNRLAEEVDGAAAETFSTLKWVQANTPKKAMKLLRKELKKKT